MRRKDKQTAPERALSVVDNCLYASLATVNPTGTPYCIPVTIARERNNIYFHCATEGKKLENISENSGVCLSCVLYAENKTNEFSVSYESAIVYGKAELVTDDTEKIRALRLISERHVPQCMDRFDEEIEKSLHRTAVVRVEIREVTGKKG